MNIPLPIKGKEYKYQKSWDINWEEIFGMERPSVTYEKTKRIEWIASEEDEKLGWVKAGDKGTQLPLPKNNEEALERFIKITAQIHFEYLQVDLIKRFGDTLRKELIDAELFPINEFVQNANTPKYLSNFHSSTDVTPEREYLRYIHGYYKNHPIGFGSDSRIYGRYILYKEWLEGLLKHLYPKQTKTKTNHSKTTLFDIWLPDDEVLKRQTYKYYIDHLKNEYRELQSPFVTEINGTLQWNKIPQRGWVQYMAGFIYTCLHNNHIKNEYSSTDYNSILKNTFNVGFNVKPFKQIYSTPPYEKYLKPFKNLPTNSNPK